MSASVLYMSMSLDGYVADRNESPDRLHEWLFPGAEGYDLQAAVARLRGASRQVYDEPSSPAAGPSNPRAAWDGDHHDGVPIYILSRNPAPAWAALWPAVHYVSDLEAAVRDAKHAAGDADVLVHGASIAQRALSAGLLDELEISLVPSCWAEADGCSSTSTLSRAASSGSGFSKETAASPTSATRVRR